MKSANKEPVKLRIKKLSNGNKSLYLDIYVDGVRRYEFLKLYLLPSRTAEAKIANQNTMEFANAIKARRILEITSGKAQIQVLDKQKRFFQYVKEQSPEVSNVKNAVYQLLLSYGKDIKCCNIGLQYVLDFQNYIKGFENLKEGTIYAYCTTFKYFVTKVYKDGYIAKNPYDHIDAKDKLKQPQSNRSYLTIEELRVLQDARLKSKSLQKALDAFLFACFCGLRISDILRLRWCDIVNNDGNKQIEIKMKKTKQILSLPLSKAAEQYLPTRTSIKDDALVFNLPQRITLNVCAQKAIKQAGITRKVTFHTSRHTFATMMLTLGADLYTTSKLLGHTAVSTTQIYAKIVDSKKVEAVNLCNERFVKQA